MLVEEEVAVSEAKAAGGLCGQHVQAVSAAFDGKDAHAVVPVAEQHAVAVDFCHADWVVGQVSLVVDHVNHVTGLVDWHAVWLGLLSPSWAAAEAAFVARCWAAGATAAARGARVGGVVVCAWIARWSTWPSAARNGLNDGGATSRIGGLFVILE